MRSFYMLAVFCLAFALAACGSAPQEITLTKNDNGKTIQAVPNQIVSVTLDYDSSNQFKWTLVNEPDSKVLKFLSSKFNSPIPGAVRAAGTQTWQFQTVGAGNTFYKLANQSASDPTKVTDEFSLAVVVK